MKRGFTLAEVLITVGIIGVVAAMTLPILINNYKNMVYETQFKAAVSILTQGFKKIANEAEGLENTSLGRRVYYTTADGRHLNSETHNDSWNYPFVKDYARTTWKLLKATCASVYDSTCPNKPIVSTYTKTLRADGSWMDKVPQNGLNRTWGMGLLLQNGIAMVVNADRGNCGATPYAKNSQMKTVCAEIWVDTNGEKGPNQWGRDTFVFLLDARGNLWPKYGAEWARAMYAEGTNNGDYWRNNVHLCCTSKNPECGRNPWSMGQGCAARIIENSGKIDY